MSHFYGKTEGSLAGIATRYGTRDSGLSTIAAGWQGAIRVSVTHNRETGEDVYQVYLTPWQNSSGEPRLLAEGKLDSNER
ncbi:hypothetical protein LCGC14_1392140 [marine sediment metagenome]|uniref:Uncharacterized protein n=1 Tax=marine sediment metagenome TaxID=412755 RepID=A0A0F9JZL9_9ZZZZ